MGSLRTDKNELSSDEKTKQTYDSTTSFRRPESSLTNSAFSADTISSIGIAGRDDPFLCSSVPGDVIETGIDEEILGDADEHAYYKRKTSLEDLLNNLGIPTDEEEEVNKETYSPQRRPTDSTEEIDPALVFENWFSWESIIDSYS